MSSRGSVTRWIGAVKAADPAAAQQLWERYFQQLTRLARQRLREKIPQLQEALLGEVTEHHRFLLKMLLEQVEFREGHIARLSSRITEVLPAPCAEAVARLETIPGTPPSLAIRRDSPARISSSASFIFATM